MNELKNIETKSNDLVTQAQSTAIKTQGQYINAAEFLKSIKTLKKEIVGTFKPIIDKAYAAHKEACSQKNKYLSPLEGAEKLINNKMSDWDDEQERKRRLEQAKIDEKARKEAEKLAERAKKAEEKGNTEKADELKEQAQEKEIAVPVAPPATPKVEGLSKRVIWKAKVTDPNKVPREYLTVNMTLLNTIARSTKGTLKVEGVEFYPEKSFTGRG
jgi:hypothetical protein